MLQLLMKIGSPADVPNDLGELPLHRASKLGDLAVIWILIGSKSLFSDEPMSKEEIKLFLEAGRKNKLPASRLSSNEKDLSMEQSDKQCESEIKPVQASGVNSRVTKTGETALHYAVSSEEGICVVDVVKLLIHAGADVNIQNTEGHTPLYLACSGNQTASAKMLLKAGANPNIKGTKKEFFHNFKICDSSGVLPLSLSAKHNNTELVQELINHGSLFSVADGEDINMTGDCIQDPLFTAFFHNADGAAYCLLNNAARFGKSFDVNTRDSLGSSYLMAVAHCDSQQVHLAEKLLDLGCDINQQIEDEGDTALHRATQRESPDLVSVLLHHGADQQTNVYNRTPLHIAIMNGDMESLKLLLAHGADFTGSYNCPEFLPIPLLMLAMDLMHFDIANFLIDCGADLNKESYLFDLSYPGNREFIDRLYNEHDKFAEKIVALGRNAPSLFCQCVRKIRSEFQDKL